MGTITEVDRGPLRIQTRMMNQYWGDAVLLVASEV
jgi:hypothetical protein